MQPSLLPETVPYDPDADPQVNWRPPVSVTQVPDKMGVMRLEEFYRGHFDDLSSVECPLHFDKPDCRCRLTHDGSGGRKQGQDRKYLRVVCNFLNEERRKESKSFSVLKLWYQASPTLEIPKELLNAYHFVSTKAAYQPPSGAVIMARPITRHTFDDNAYAVEDHVRAKALEVALAKAAATEELTVSPRGKSYFEEGLLSAKQSKAKQIRKSFTPRSPSDRGTINDDENSDSEIIESRNESMDFGAGYDNTEDEAEKPSKSVPVWMTPKKTVTQPQGMATPPMRILTTNVNRFKALEDPTEALVAAIAEEVQNRILSSPIFTQLAAAMTPERINRREAEAVQTAEKNRTNSSSFAAEVASYIPAPKARPGQAPQPAPRRTIMTEEYKKMIYAGKDPRKTRLTEVYLGDLRRTFKSNIRQALRADNVPTQHIADIQFVGKNVTILVIPIERAEEVLRPLRQVKHFRVLEQFDPMDITFMRSLPQYVGKSDAELAVLARKQAMDRIQRYIDSLPDNRQGMKKYYTIRKKQLESRESSNMVPEEPVRTPTEITMADHIGEMLDELYSNPLEDSIAESLPLE